MAGLFAARGPALAAPAPRSSEASSLPIAPSRSACHSSTPSTSGSRSRSPLVSLITVASSKTTAAATVRRKSPPEAFAVCSLAAIIFSCSNELSDR